MLPDIAHCFVLGIASFSLFPHAQSLSMVLSISIHLYVYVIQYYAFVSTHLLADDDTRVHLLDEVNDYVNANHVVVSLSDNALRHKLYMAMSVMHHIINVVI